MPTPIRTFSLLRRRIVDVHIGNVPAGQARRILAFKQGEFVDSGSKPLEIKNEFYFTTRLNVNMFGRLANSFSFHESESSCTVGSNE